MTIHFVYLLTFANGKIYVGMSKTDKKGAYTTRFRDHVRSAKVGKSLPIYNAWRKHGAPMQTILSKHETRESCAAAEVREIEARKATDPAFGYNLMRGGEGMHAPKGSPMHALMREKVWGNPAVREKLRAANKGKPPSPQALAASVAERQTPAGRERMRRTVWENPEVCAKLSVKTRAQMANGGAENVARIRREQGDRRSPEQVAAHAEFMRARMNTPEGKAQARKAQAVMLSNPENVAKLEAGRAAWRNSEKNAAHCKAIAQKAAEVCRCPVVDNSTGIQYPSQRDMARALGLTEAAISKRVKAGKVTKLGEPKT